MRRGADALLAVYAAALFASALLAFWVQPLVTKIVLPHYGGSASVWTTTAMFFQVGLLAGYLYAHALSRRALRTQFAVHAAVIAVALAMLPLHAIAIHGDESAPIVSLLTTLAFAVGVPYFAISATAPLLQHWFSRTGHAEAADPYFLYAASNTGSLLALIGYPLMLEPLLGLKTQTRAWSIGCGLLALMLAVCAVRVYRGVTAPQALPLSRAEHVAWRERARWALLAFAPASLMLGVTQHISSEIASAPLLWLLPLTLYVLTFIAAFARRSIFPLRIVERVQPIVVLVLVLAWPLDDFKSVLGLHLAAFAVTAMMCHATLAHERPAAPNLTEFYLWIAIGGAAGGIFNALVAPLVFDSILEYPIALGVACALRSQSARGGLRDLADAAGATLVAVVGVLALARINPYAHGTWAVVAFLQFAGIALYLASARPRVFALCVLGTILATPLIHSADRVLERHRDFFGVHTVLRDNTGKLNVLMHGITIHGAEYIAADKATRPTTYYHSDSGIADILRTIAPRRVAVLGMGVGTLACYRAPGREWSFFEIDPQVVKLAQDTRYFTYLSRCAPDAHVVVGDARLSLARVPDDSYDLIVVDTFSSDSIPLHMLTREAIAMFLSKLTRDGILVFHITNQYLDLVPALSRLAADAGVAAVMPGPRFEIYFDERLAALPSRWVAVSRDPARFEALIRDVAWKPLPAQSGKPWTDDFSNLLGALK